MYKADGKRPDGITLASWKCGQLLVWDATALTPNNSGWVYQALDTAVANGMASAQTNSGGMFVAASKTAIISVATVLVVIVVLATVVTVSLVVYFRVKKGAWQNFKTAVKNVPKLRRHVAGKV